MLKTKEEIKDWLKEHNIRNYIINEDLTVDVNEDVDLSSRKINFFPFQFGIIKGNFNCSYNKLISLEYCPKEIEGYFNCSSNKLTSLEHCPKKIGGKFNCSRNQLISLEHCPKEIKGNFNCSHNKLTSLEYCPEEIKGSFYCTDNQLTSLKYGPKEIGNEFYCDQNQLTSLEYCPEKINGDFDCSYNQLTSLEYCPNVVGDFFCYNNDIQKESLFCFNSVIEDIISDFGTKEEFFLEVNKQKSRKEKEELNELMIDERNFKNKQKTF